LFPTFPKTISITIALKLVVNKFLAHWIISDLIRKDLWDEDNIAELLKNMIRLEASIPTIATVLVSVKQKKCAGTGEGRYQPTRSKTCRLQTSKREKKDFSTTEQRAYNAVNLSKNSCHKVQIRKKVLLVVVQIS